MHYSDHSPVADREAWRCATSSPTAAPFSTGKATTGTNFYHAMFEEVQNNYAIRDLCISATSKPSVRGFSAVGLTTAKDANRQLVNYTRLFQLLEIMR